MNKSRLAQAIEDAATGVIGRVTVLAGREVFAALSGAGPYSAFRHRRDSWYIGPSGTIRFGRGIPVLEAPTMPPGQWRIVLDTSVEGTLAELDNDDVWAGVLD